MDAIYDASLDVMLDSHKNQFCFIFSYMLSALIFPIRLYPFRQSSKNNLTINK